jgi:hypothetical protein
MITGEYGQRVIFEQIKECINNENSIVFESDRNERYYRNLKSSIPLLIKKQIISAPSDVLKISTLAWDMGRLVNIARWSYDLEYITEIEAWGAIYVAYEQVLKMYGHWQEFANGYLLGRAMWGGTSGMLASPFSMTRIIKLKTIIEITKCMLKYKGSPWNLIPFK